ncbi:MAG: topoisomerase DNA-binding C4 zinc finger domain-containing protein [Deltaproteobacteria bacterium]|nr:topoisomerase DNA-binding C4 zinc finger domain-containing protein [Deltaproteobacteria bacterium]
MEKPAENKPSEGVTLRECFDKIFFQHMDRLLGSHYGIDDLPLNLVNVTSMILLTEQLTEEMENFSNPSERYTLSTLFQEITEMGLAMEEDTEDILQDIIQKEYAGLDEEGHISAKTPTISVVQMIDRAFPKMPGLNLIASLAQAVDEARSGRKDLESALRVFDQILKMQGVPLSQEKSSRKGRKSSTTSTKIKERTPASPIFIPPSTIGPRRKLSDIYQAELLKKIREQSQKQTEREGFAGTGSEEGVSLEPNDIETLSSDETATDESGIKDIPFQEMESSLPQAPQGETADAAQLPDEEKAEEEDDRAGMEPREDAQDAQPEMDETEELSDEDETAALTGDSAYPRTGYESLPPEPGADEAKESEPEAEPEPCPLCKTGVISREETSTGKTYYKCNAPECNFISWGKPFHIPCPQCQNPFLVEGTKRDGTEILKCPRATCGYWQEHSTADGPGVASAALASPKGGRRKRRVVRRPRRRVVRRRVVKKKR